MNYEIMLIQKNLDEIDTLPNIEDLYDMDKESLLKVKSLLDLKFPKLLTNYEKEKKRLAENQNQNDDNDNFLLDLDLEEDSLYDDIKDFNNQFKVNGLTEDEIDLPRLYAFLLSEISQREYQENTVGFFLNENSLLKLTEDNFSDVNFNIENNNNIKDLKDIREREINLNETEKSNLNLQTNNTIINNTNISNINNKSNITNNNSNTTRSNTNYNNTGEKPNINIDFEESSLKEIKDKLSSKKSKLAIMKLLENYKEETLIVDKSSINNNLNNNLKKINEKNISKDLIENTNNISNSRIKTNKCKTPSNNINFNEMKKIGSANNLNYNSGKTKPKKSESKNKLINIDNNKYETEIVVNTNVFQKDPVKNILKKKTKKSKENFFYLFIKIRKKIPKNQRMLYS